MVLVRVMLASRDVGCGEILTCRMLVRMKTKIAQCQSKILYAQKLVQKRWQAFS